MITDAGKTERVETERVRELLGAATAGPWTVFDDAEPLVFIEAPDPEDPRAHLIVAELAGGPANAALIATAPDLTADLLDAREELARLRTRLASMTGAVMREREARVARETALRAERLARCTSEGDDVAAWQAAHERYTAARVAHERATADVTALLSGAPADVVRAGVMRDLLARFVDGDIQRRDFIAQLAALAAAEGR